MLGRLEWFARDSRRRNQTPHPAWLRLIRAPNLMTVPGDPLAGFILAGGASWLAAPVMAAATLLYAGALALNDAHDVEEDRRERPDRPIPSGLISRSAARGVAVALGAAAVLLAGTAGKVSGVIALWMAVTAAFYNLLFKRTSVGPWIMGACRGQSVLLGAAAARNGDAASALATVMASLALMFYTAALTALAKTETETARVEWRRWAPAMVALGAAGAAVIIGADAAGRWAGALLAILAAIRAVEPAERWNIAPPAARRMMTGRLVSGLLMLQGSFLACAGAPFVIAGVLWALLAPLHRLLAGRWNAD